MALLDATILFVAFPNIRRSFPAVSAADLSWVLNAYNVVYAAMLVPAGRFADRVGRRRMFLLGVTVFTLGSLACGISPTPLTYMDAPRFAKPSIGDKKGKIAAVHSALVQLLAAGPDGMRLVGSSIAYTH